MIESKKHSSKRLKTDRDDAPELTSEWFAGADLYKGMKLVKRGRPAGSGARVLISLRLDKQAIAAYRATGSKWQSRLNEVVVRSAKRLKAPAGLAKFDRLMARKGGQSRRKSDEAPKEYGKSKGR